MTALPPPPVDVGAALPALVPYVLRMEIQRPQGGRLEGRFFQLGATPGAVDLYCLELAVLCMLNHPVFPSVLSYGVKAGKFGYVVPRLEAQPLSDRLRDPDLPAALRMKVVSQLARGIAAAHRAGVALGDLRLEALYWDAAAQSVLIPFPLGHRHAGLTRLVPLPADFERRSPAARDIAAWATVSLALLAGTSEIFDPKGRRRNLGEGSGQVRGALLGLAQDCVWGDLDIRPQNGPELTRLLEGIFQEIDVNKSYGALQLTAPASPAKVLANLREEAEDIEIELAEKLNLEAVTEFTSQFATRAVEGLAELPGETKHRALVVVVGLVAALLFVRAMKPLFEVPPTATTATQAAEARASNWRASPEFARFVAEPVVATGSFRRRWNQLRGLLVAGHLPPGSLTSKDLRSLRNRLEADPDAAVEALEKTIVTLANF